MLESGDLRKGTKLDIDGDPFVIIQFEFVKPGKGQALYKCKLKNMISGTIVDKTYRSGEKFNPANLEEVSMEYLYFDGNQYCFMNSATYEQVFLTEAQMEEAKPLLKENTVCSVLLFNGNPIGVTLPNFVELKIESCEPWVKGDTASGSNKPATLETGAVIQVPPFLESGEKVKIDTRTGQYVERVKG